MSDNRRNDPPVVTQVAVVVRDLDAAIRAYHRVLGWGPWRIYDFDQLPHHGTTVRAAPATYSMRTALTRVGGLDFEIVEPGEGPSPYREFLEEKGEGLHHILCRDPDGGSSRILDRMSEHGLPVLMAGSVGDILDYAYHDGGGELNVLIETINYGADGRGLTPTAVYPPEE